ncbi:MAG: SpoIIIAH-like family protein [Clostridia bacterium]|nr:SpoIIIAH-like family protein [Clostridia bacterium]
MKKGKVFGKNQVIAFLMVICLGGAVWLNMRFSSKEKYLGEASFVSNTGSKAVATSAKVSAETDYFTEAKDSREKALDEARDTVKELLKTDKLTDDEKKNATDKVSEIAKRIENANNIETLIKAKGFDDAVAVISEKAISIVVKSDGLTTPQTLQIQEIVTSETNIGLGNIKIVTVK